MSLLLCLGVLLLSLAASGVDLHELFHEDACETSHECAVSLFAHGQVDLTDAAVHLVVRTLPVATLSLLMEQHFISDPHFRFLPERGPPVFS